jgi:UDP-3-O-[3-hydroxymyristoyl] glucosamine N-acyltransferase
MRRSMVLLLALPLLFACSKDKYLTNPDGTTPVLYSRSAVLRWPVIDGAYQDPSGKARIYLDQTAKLPKDFSAGDGVRLGARSSIGEDAVLFPNVTVGDDSSMGRDAIVQSDVKIGNKVSIGNDTVVGQATTIEDGATIGKWVKIGSRASIGSRAEIGGGATVADGATVANDQRVPQGEHVAK